MAISEQLKSPVRLLRSSFGHGNPYPSNSVFVGHGSKWANPFKKADVDALRGEPALENYHLLPTVRGDLLFKLERFDEARREFERAAVMTRNAREQALLGQRVAECAEAAAACARPPLERGKGDK